MLQYEVHLMNPKIIGTQCICPTDTYVQETSRRAFSQVFVGTINSNTVLQLNGTGMTQAETPAAV